jgi:hypothetical protein
LIWSSQAAAADTDLVEFCVGCIAVGGVSKSFESELSFRKGEENARENRPCCLLGLGNTGLIGDLETEIGLAS